MLKLDRWLSLPTMWVILFMHPLASVPLERSQRWNTWTASALVTIADTQGRISTFPDHLQIIMSERPFHLHDLVARSNLGNDQDYGGCG